MKYLITIVRLIFLALFVFLLAQGQMTLWLALVGAGLLVSLIFGRIYCGYVCPMNTLMIPTNWIAKKLKFQTKKTPKWLGNGYFAWIALVVSVAAMLLLKQLFQINLPVLPIWLAVSVIVTLRYRPSVFHNLLCPFGALQKLFGRFAKQRKRVDESACSGCKLCEKVCPSDAITVGGDNKKAAIETALCHQCTSCAKVCPAGAIHYK